jgi:hypothetical protein
VRDGDLLEDERVDLRITLRWIFICLNGSIDWIVLTQNRNKWRAVVNAVIKIHVPENAGKSFTSLKNRIDSRRNMFHGVIK